jgi:recombination protein RecT
MSTNNQLQKTPGEPPVVQLLQRMGPEIARALPRHLSADRMARVALTALRTTPRLLECSPASVLGAIMSAAQLGLEPNTPLGLAYLIPYKRECQLIVGYQGYLELARRSGLVSAPQAHAVREGDTFEYALGLAPYLRHVPSDLADRETRPITHVYAVAHQLPQGSAPPIFVVLSAAQVEARKARSMAVRAGRSTPWDTDPEAMALKTAIRALWRWLPKTAEMAQAAELDGVAERGGGQSAAWSSVAHEALSAAGVAADDPEIDETTGEVVEAPAAEGASASDRLAAKLRG